MKLKWKTIAYWFIGLTLFYMLGIPLIANIPSNRAFIENKIYQTAGIKVNLGNARISMGSFPSVWFESNNISVINSDGSKALSIDKPRVKILLLPLVFKRINIPKVYSSKENINLILTKDKKFMLGDYPLEFKSNGKFKLDKLNVKMGEYDIYLDDKWNNEKVELKGRYINNAGYARKKKIKFATEGNFIVGTKDTPYKTDFELNLPLKDFKDNKLKINADIKDFDISSIGDYVSVLTDGLIQDLKGIVNFSAKTKKTKFGHKIVYTKLNSTGLEILGVDKPSSIVHHEPLNIDINFETKNGGVKFKNTSLTGKGIKILFDGKLSDSGKRIPAMDFVIEIKPSELGTASNLLPWLREVPREMDFYKFKQYKIWGKGEGKLHFVGKGDRPDVFGNVKLSNVDAVQRGIVSPEGASVNMDFIGKKMKIDVYVPTENNQYVEVKGTAKIDGSRYSELDIDSSDSIVMESAQIILNPLHEMLKFKIGPVPIMKIKGLGEIHVQSRGKKVDPHLWGKMTFRNATAEFIQIHNLILHNGSGEIIFNDRDITFKTFTAVINGRNTDIHGKCDVFGNLDVIAETKGQNIPDMIKVINTSSEMRDVQRVIKPFTNPQGIGDLYLNIYDNAKDVTQVAFNKDIFAKGTVTFHNASTLLKDTYLPFKDINGFVNFDKKDADYDLTGYIRNSNLHVKGTAHDKDMDLTASANKFKLIDILDMFHPDMFMPLKKEIGNLFISFNGKYKGVANSDNLEYEKIIADGKIISNSNSNNPIKVYNGDFNIKNSILYGNNISGNIEGNPYTLSFSGSDIYHSMKIKDAQFKFDNFDVSVLNEMKNLIDLPSDARKIAEDITDIQGHINIDGYMKNGGIYTNTDLKNLSFTYKPYDAVIKFLSGYANMRGDTLYLSKVNTKVSSMPVYLNGSVSNVMNNPNANLYMSGKLNQEFLDKFVNAKSVYPVKLKGDAIFTSKINGTFNGFHSNSSLNVAENSSIYYMGATLSGAPSGIVTSEGISTNPVSIIADADIYPHKVRINSFDYNQMIQSQNKRASVQKQLTMSGLVTLLKNNVLKFDNLRIKTFEPTDAKIFNILLKKPTIKQGVFSANVTVNGTSLAPKANGKLNITSIDIPLLDATIRDVDVDFQNDYIYVNSKGVILTNDITFLAKILNNPQPPYIIEDMQIKTDVLDLNVIANRFNDYDTDKLRAKQVENSPLPVSPDSLIIKNAQISADKILIKKAQATDFNADMDITKDGILHVNKYIFSLANGQISGDITSNLNTMDSTANMSIKNADAQIIAENFFDLTGQVYGNVTGDLTASCKGISGVECLNTLNGQGDFVILDGRMPKLGSLEYLLKAANLVTGGIGAVSINGIIDLITPLKTGDFDKITGDVKVQNGVATDINVYSYGKELNMYLTGSYDLSTLVADMEVYGSLSKNFSTLLGRIGNASLNRLLNAIPGININEINPESTSNIRKIPNFDPNNILRVFKAEILGDINGSNYVKSFKWIKH